MHVDTGTDKLLARIEDGIGWLTYNAPERHNALSLGMQLAAPGALRAFPADPDVRVIIVHGAGGRAFVSGADISEFGEKRTSVEARAEYDNAANEAWGSWREVDKPILAMIQGYCMGGGLFTAIQTDIRICSEGSVFGVPAAKLGLGYGYGGVEQLVALTGPAWAAEILFSARRLSAEEALQAGVVNRIVPAEQLQAGGRGVGGTNAPHTPPPPAAPQG